MKNLLIIYNVIFLLFGNVLFSSIHYLHDHNHNDEVHEMPQGFRIMASSDACQVQVMQHETLPYAGVQYHPEVENTDFGAEIFQNFLDKAIEWTK